MAKSALATRISHAILKTDLSDPMSGFFMIRASVARDLVPRLGGIGFKILLDLVTASPRPLKLREMGYTFRTRAVGESKLDHVVAMEFLLALYDRAFGKVVPVRFVMFSAIGLIGLAVHMLVLTPIYVGGGRSYGAFRTGEIIATIVAMSFNFFLNNALTYRDRRLKGARQLLDGWIGFCLVCGVGAIANVGIALFLHDARQGEWAVSAIVGVALGAVWNYALSSRFVWGRY